MTETPHTPLEALNRLIAAIDKLGIRQLVAGWNGENREDGPYEPHPKRLGVKLPTNAGCVYEIDAATEAARTVATPLPTTANNPETDAHRDLVEAARVVVDHFDYVAEGNSPGHAHKKLGVWDGSGLPCEWCAQWNAFRAALTKAEVTHG